MRIGELARAARCTVETIRFYERVGLLAAPARTAANYRDYTPAHLERLRSVRNCRTMDLSHDEIRALLDLAERPGDDCGGINRLIDEHIEAVAGRIEALQRLRARLEVLRGRCSVERSVEACGVMAGLADLDAEVADVA